VVQRDTITSYALQCPTSIGELGLRHGEQMRVSRLSCKCIQGLANHE
jgi:hypothetical protein